MSQATVRIPAPLRPLTGGASEVVAQGESVREVLQAVGEAHEGLARQLLTDAGEVREFVNVFLGDTNIRSLAGLDSPVEDGAVIHVVPAVAGGAT